MAHMKVIGQASTGIKDPVCNLPVEIDNGPVQGTDMQLVGYCNLATNIAITSKGLVDRPKKKYIAISL